MSSRTSTSSTPVRVPSGIIRFGACELRVATRELLFCRQISPVSPKAFDVLLYLIEHRERVVTKNELLDAIWRTSYVSESVIARMVMKIRRAIGDTAEVSQLIRTVHRIGYRFIGALEIGVQQPVEPWRVSSHPAAPARVVLLPFKNATGIAELGWIDWGLPSLVLQAFLATGEVTPVPLRDSILILGALAEGMPAAECALAMMRATSADFGLAAVVSGAIGRFRIEWTLYGPTGECIAAHLNGMNLPELTITLAGSVSHWIVAARSEGGQAPSVYSGPPDDHLAR